MIGITLAQESNGGELAAIGVFAGLLGVVLLFVFLVNLVLTFFLWSAYKAVPAEHQKFPSGLVWLCVIPCLGSIALIVCSVLVPLSFQAAFAARGAGQDSAGRGAAPQGDCGLLLGLLGSVGMVVGSAIPGLGVLLGVAGLVIFILFLVKIANCKRALLLG
jgi:hypothetical protein